MESKVKKKLPEKPQVEAEKDEDSWAHEQENRGYYYDDNTGYEVYNPENDDEENGEAEQLLNSIF